MQGIADAGVIVTWMLNHNFASRISTKILPVCVCIFLDFREPLDSLCMWIVFGYVTCMNCYSGPRIIFDFFFSRTLSNGDFVHISGWFLWIPQVYSYMMENVPDRLLGLIPSQHCRSYIFINSDIRALMHSTNEVVLRVDVDFNVHVSPWMFEEHPLPRTLDIFPFSCIPGTRLGIDGNFAASV